MHTRRLPPTSTGHYPGLDQLLEPVADLLASADDPADLWIALVYSLHRQVQDTNATAREFLRRYTPPVK